MIATTFANLIAHKRRLLGAGLAVVLGVAFLAATLILGATLRGGFRGLFESADAGTAAVVRNPSQVGDGNAQARGLVDAGLVPVVAAVPGVSRAVPEVDGAAQLVGADGRPVGGGGPPTLAGSWLGSSSLNPYHLVAGRAPVARASGPVEVVVDRRSARVGRLGIGGPVTVLTPQPVRAVVVGLAGFGSGDSMAGATYTAFSLADAQRILLVGRQQISQVRVAADAGVSQADLARRIRGVLPASAEVVTGRDLARQQQRDVEGSFVDPLETFLLIFAGVAVLVATFSIANTFSILAAQRTRAARAASRHRRLPFAGAGRLGAGGGGGRPGGVDRRRGGRRRVGRRAARLAGGRGHGSAPQRAGRSRLGRAVGRRRSGWGPRWWPAWCRRCVPRGWRRSRPCVTWPSAGAPSGRLRLVVGVIVVAGGLAALIGGASGSAGVGLVGLAALVTLAGAVLIGPAVTRPVSAVLGRPLRLAHGVSGELAQLNTTRQARRSSAAASALMIGVGVVVLFTVFAASIKTSLDRSVAQSFRGDLVVSPVGAGTDTGISPSVAAAVRALPQVRAAAGPGQRGRDPGRLLAHGHRGRPGPTGGGRPTCT